MEVYSDRISIDQHEQERLRFSPDDVLRLPVHHAINVWIADGVPRAGFVAQTLAMEDLHNPHAAEHHRAAQRARGAHHPARLPNLLRDDEEPPDGESASPAQPPKGPRPQGPRRARGRDAAEDQQNLLDGYEAMEG